MAIEGTIKTPFGTMQKKTAVIAGVGLVGIAGIAWYRSKQQAASTAAANPPVDTSTTDPNAIDPATGLPYSEETAGSQGFADQLGSGGYYDSGGNWIPYSQQAFPSTNPGPGSFTSNPQWVQYVEDYLVNTAGLSSADVGAAIGKYIAGLPVTSDQVSIITQAIAIGGQPPSSGNGGYPPNYHEQASTPPPTNGQVTVPNIVGLELEQGYSILRAAGLKYNDQGSVPHTTVRTITTETPKAGTKVNSGTKIGLGYRTTHRR